MYQFICKVAFVLFFSVPAGSILQAQSNWPCPRCSMQVFEPDTNATPYTVNIQEPSTKCVLAITYRNVLCETTPPCAIMYLESISAVNACCDLDDLQMNLVDLVDFVTRYALLTNPVKFSLGADGGCARVYKKRCWSRTNVLAHGCTTEYCCYAERNGSTITYQSMPVPDSVCQSLVDCTYVCKP